MTVVFYSDIIEGIILGENNKYPFEMQEKLGDWAENDKRSQAVINKERKL